MYRTPQAVESLIESGALFTSTSECMTQQSNNKQIYTAHTASEMNNRRRDSRAEIRYLLQDT